ncbi:glycosyltransferase family 4 protein [Cohnella yongneupensis]|uniref:Glycosyltransferase family 4 protein n=1 Tax=Cohnella yongneupensis TaxID=425006 RepID=A0ABW0R0N9_9BACL
MALKPRRRSTTKPKFRRSRKKGRIGRGKPRRLTSKRWLRRNTRRKSTRRRRTQLKLLFLTHAFYPESYAGTEKFILNMARSMIRKGHRVKVVTYSQLPPENYPHAVGEVIYREYIHEGVPVVAYRHKQFDPALKFDVGDRGLSLFARKVLRAEKPDLVHVGHPMRTMAFMQACKQLRIKYVVTLTDFWFICPKGIMLRNDKSLCGGPGDGGNCLNYCQIPNVQQRLQSHIPLLRSASRVLSPSVFLANLIRGNLPNLPVEVLNHGMKADNIRVNERIYQPGDTLTLFYGGTLAPHKGVHLILEAMSMIPTERLRLKIYGSGQTEYMQQLEQAAAGLDGRVEFCGVYSENDLPRIYQDVDVAVVPSIWYENYPLTLHEALISQVPALVSNVGGMAEKVADGFNGFTFRIGEAAHLAERIGQLLDNPQLLNDFKANMRAVQFPTLEQEADTYERIYKSIAR